MTLPAETRAAGRPPVVPARPNRRAAPGSRSPQPRLPSVGRSSHHDPSPLNDPKYDHSSHPGHSEGSVSPNEPDGLSPEFEHQTKEQKLSVRPDLPPRPASVARLPTIGQEGLEYSLLDHPSHLNNSNHPDADSNPASVDDTDGTRPTITTELASASEDVLPYKPSHSPGIPEIGVQIPLYPHAGDVQAPASTGITHHHTGESSTTNGGRRSHELRDVPPDSYGRHGHGSRTELNHFEQDWYEKHPGELVREESYSAALAQPNELALSRTELEALVHRKPESMSDERPNEELEGLALDRVAAESKPGMFRNPTNISIDVIPPREETGSLNDAAPAAVSGSNDGPKTDDDAGERLPRTSSDDMHPILAEDEQIKHPDSTFRRPAVSPNREHIESDHEDETKSSQAKVSGTTGTHTPGSVSSGGGASGVRPHGRREQTVMRENSRSTPLEALPEYEPLFPDDDEETRRAKEAHNANVDQTRRHHFPSEDVWEDSPSSHQLQTTVALEEPNQGDGDGDGVNDDDKPSAWELDQERELERKRELEREGVDAAFLPEHLERLRAPIKVDESEKTTDGRRGNIAFPSKDVWEEAADHCQLVTTIDKPGREREGGDDGKEGDDKKDDVDGKADIGVKGDVDGKTGNGSRSSSSDGARTKAAPPPLPSRPAKKPELPDRPKRPVGSRPAIPPRPLPASALSMFSSQPAGSGSGPHPTDRPKPAVPARPSGSKIAALKAGFMKDLNSKLQVGMPPALGRDRVKAQADVDEHDPEAASFQPVNQSKKTAAVVDEPKATNPVDEDTVEPEGLKPLPDIRSGRARGPPRRLPSRQAGPKSVPVAVAESKSKSKPEQNLTIGPVVTIFSIDDDCLIFTGTGRAAVSRSSVCSVDVSLASALVSTPDPVASPLVVGGGGGSVGTDDGAGDGAGDADDDVAPDVSADRDVSVGLGVGAGRGVGAGPDGDASVNDKVDPEIDSDDDPDSVPVVAKAATT